MPDRPLSEELWDADLMARQIQNYLGTNKRAAHWRSGFNRGIEWLRNHIGSRLIALEAENARLRKVYEAAAEVLPLICGVVDGNVWCARCGVIDARAGDEHEQDCVVCALDDAVREAVLPLVEESESGQGFIRTDARKNPAVREARDGDEDYPELWSNGPGIIL